MEWPYTMFLQDKIAISAKSERVYTDEGYLKVPARIARTGIQDYAAFEMGLDSLDPNQLIRVYRPDKEVFKQESLDSFKEKPVTNDHPPELVDATNIKKYGIGWTGHQVERDQNFVKANLIITDAEIIKLINSGKVELSNGYTADIDWTPGVTQDGEHYDAIQTNIKGNHVAIVVKGRAGEQVRLSDQFRKSEDTMKVSIFDVDYEVNEQTGQAVNKLLKRLKDTEEEMKKQEDEDEEELKAAKEKADQAEKKTEDMKAKLDDALSKVPTPEALDKMVADRQSFIDQVQKLDAKYEWKGKNTKTIKKELVGQLCSNVQIDSVSEDYIQARFDLLLDNLGASGVQQLDNALADTLNNGDQGDQGEVDTRTPSMIARDKAIERNRNAWKNKA